MKTCLVYIILVLVYAVASLDLREHITYKIQKLIDEGKIQKDIPKYEDGDVKDEEKYDFIIVGAGSAGSVLVNRLSQVKKWKILLLEAGGEPELTTDIPLLSGLAHFGEQNWKFFTEKEDNFALGLRNQRMHWPRGKGLGGTSLLNYMVFSRGAKQDYDKWASLGNPGWSYDDLLPHFKKIENCKIKHQDRDFRGHDGELEIEDPRCHSKVADLFLKSAKSLGYNYIDYNGKEHVGASYFQSTTKKGLRCSGERCFIRKAKGRKNLTIRTRSHVTKVIIDNNVRARGIEFVKDGKTYKAFATKDVILSAGVINSAHLLMLSGIGPKEYLEKFDIKVIRDLPVGKKIYDHPLFWPLSYYSEEQLTYNMTVIFDDDSYIKLYKEGDGPLHNLGGLETVLFATTELTKDKELADIEILYWSLHPGSYEDYGIGRTMGVSSHIYDTVYRPLRDKHLFSTVVILLHPESYGRMELRSKNPFDYPKLYGGYFTDPEAKDMKTMIAGIKIALRLFNSEPFKRYNLKMVETPIPGCEKHKFASDEYWECAIRHLATTVYHHTTTCKMGPKNDLEAVVDHRLRVYGVDGLRIADTSVIPIQITGHTNVPAYLVGEKAAAMIIEDYRGDVTKDEL